MGLLDDLNKNIDENREAKTQYNNNVNIALTKEEKNRIVEKIVEESNLKKKIADSPIQEMGMLNKRYFYKLKVEYYVKINKEFTSDRYSVIPEKGISVDACGGRITVTVSNIQQIIDIYDELTAYLKRNKIDTKYSELQMSKDTYHKYPMKDKMLIKSAFRLDDALFKDAKIVINGKIYCDRNGEIL